MSDDAGPVKARRRARALELTWRNIPRNRRRPAGFAVSVKVSFMLRGVWCALMGVRPRWPALGAGVVALVLAGSALAFGMPQRVPLILRDGLFYVPVRLLGCVQQPDLELLLDTGSAVTVLPQSHMKRMGDRRTALSLGEANVEMVDGGATEANRFLVEGLRIGGCPIPAVRVIACPSEGSHWKLVLGMDVLSRLEDVRIELGPRGGELVFTCPPEPDEPAGECD